MLAHSTTTSTRLLFVFVVWTISLAIVLPCVCLQNPWQSAAATLPQAALITIWIVIITCFALFLFACLQRQYHIAWIVFVIISMVGVSALQWVTYKNIVLGAQMNLIALVLVGACGLLQRKMAVWARLCFQMVWIWVWIVFVSCMIASLSFSTTTTTITTDDTLRVNHILPFNATDSSIHLSEASFRLADMNTITGSTANIRAITGSTATIANVHAESLVVETNLAGTDAQFTNLQTTGSFESAALNSRSLQLQNTNLIPVFQQSMPVSVTCSFASSDALVVFAWGDTVCLTPSAVPEVRLFTSAQVDLSSRVTVYNNRTDSVLLFLSWANEEAFPQGPVELETNENGLWRFVPQEQMFFGAGVLNGRLTIQSSSETFLELGPLRALDTRVRVPKLFVESSLTFSPEILEETQASLASIKVSNSTCQSIDFASTPLVWGDSSCVTRDLCLVFSVPLDQVLLVQVQPFAEPAYVDTTFYAERAMLNPIEYHLFQTSCNVSPVNNTSISTGGYQDLLVYGWLFFLK